MLDLAVFRQGPCYQIRPKLKALDLLPLPLLIGMPLTRHLYDVGLLRLYVHGPAQLEYHYNHLL